MAIFRLLKARLNEKGKITSYESKTISMSDLCQEVTEISHIYIYMQKNGDINSAPEKRVVPLERKL